MPNYTSHAVMAEKIEIKAKIPLKKELIRSYSIGPDLMITYKNALERTHNENTQVFFLNLVDTIKKNHLEKNPNIISYLYGQILHYALDTTVHPYVYYITNDVPKIGFFEFHTVLEEYLGIYLCQTQLHIERKNVKSSFYTNFEWEQDTKLKPYINQVYEKTYHIKNAIFAQKLTEQIIKLIDKSTYFMQGNNGETYLQFLGLYKYLQKIKMQKNDLANENHETWYNPITKEKSNKSVNDLVNQAICFGQELIEYVNKVLYEDEQLSSLEQIFTNLSYDTGLDCNIGKPWVRSKIKDNKKI